MKKVTDAEFSGTGGIVARAPPDAPIAPPIAVVASQRAEPPGWLRRDDVMEAVYLNNRYVPGGIFLVWYAFVLLFKQVGRLIWLAGWEWKRRRLKRHSQGSAVVSRRSAAPVRRRSGFAGRSAR